MATTPRKNLRLWRIIIFFLLFIAVATYSTHRKHDARDWQDPLTVVIYPLAGDNSSQTRDYIQQLRAGDFAPIAQFLAQQGESYGLHPMANVHVVLGQPITKLPPKVYLEFANWWQRGLWSLQFRYWAWRQSVTPKNVSPNVRLYLVYHRSWHNRALEPSMGLKQGLLGLVHLFASEAQQAQNNVIITHELLHTLGASDKYSLETQLPLFPNGYANVNQVPLLPQKKCEIMAVQIPYSVELSIMPEGLGDCLVGRETAWEIGWGEKG